MGKGASTGSARITGDDMGVFLAEQRLDILRQYRDGVVDDLSGPWWFMDTSVSCNVNHRFAGGGISIVFGYAAFKGRVSLAPSRGPNGELQFDVQPIPPAIEHMLSPKYTGPTYDPGDVVLAVSLKDAVELVPGSVSINVDSQTWPLFRRTITMSPTTSPQSTHSYVTGGAPALKIVAAMSRPTTVAISAARAGVVSTERPSASTTALVQFKTQTTQFVEAAKKLQACVDGTARRGSSRLGP